MNVYTCNDHIGFWPVGACSIVVANDETEARALLTAALKEHGLDPSRGFTLSLLNTDTPRAFILLDGEY